ncbi:MAG: hypothetical protein ABUS47_15380 [Steroidobacter sp.]
MVEVSLGADDVFTARAAPSSYIILGTIFGTPAISAIISVILNPQIVSSLWTGLIMGCIADTFIFTWLGMFYIHIRDGKLIYRSLFGGKHNIQVNEISKVKYVLDFNPWNHPTRPVHRLEIYTANHKSPTFCINVKVFRSSDVRYLLQFFKPKIKK